MQVVAQAVAQLISGSVKRLILSRPAVEAGERLGFLPGDLAQKVDPYLRPLYDALYDLMGFDKVVKAFERQALEIAPLAFMRGRTLNNAFIIEQSRRFAKRLLQTPAESEKRIAAAYRAALGRDATVAELQRGLDFIREADAMLVSTQTDHARRELDTWAALCQALLASNELRYVD